MKKTIILLLLIALTSVAQAQQKTLSVFSVTEFSIDDKNLDSTALAQEIKLIFYISDDDKLSFAHLWQTNDSQSFGEVLKPEKYISSQTDSTWATEMIVFNWRYKNSYDDDSGEAAVILTKAFTDEAVLFTCTIAVFKDSTVSTIQLKGHQVHSAPAQDRI